MRRRTVGFCVLGFLAAQGVYAWTFALMPMGYLEGVQRWDGQIFRALAEHGYTWGANGKVGLYAFYPLFPFISRLLMALSGLPFVAVAAAVSLVCSTAGVALVTDCFYRWMGPGAAVVAAIGLSCWPAAPVLQMTFSEGVALLLFAVIIVFVLQERYTAAILPLLLLSLTRPLVAPVAAALLLTAFVRAVRRLPVDGRLVMLCGVSTLLAFLWPTVAGVMTRDPLVYKRAEDSFATPQGPHIWLLRLLGLGPGGWLILCTLLVVIGWVALRLLPVGTPMFIRAWCVTYPVYLGCVSWIHSGQVRLLLFAFPMSLVLEPLTKHHSGRVLLGLLALAGVASGVWWIATFAGSDLRIA